MNPWNNKTLRSIYDPAIDGYWFSVVDLCAILTDSSHKTARGYWKWLKDKQSSEKNEVVSVANHLKFESPNGKYYFTEVLDFKNVICLIQTCPSHKANKFRLWLADMLFQGISAKELEQQLSKLGEEARKQVAEKYTNNPNEPYARLTTQKKDLLDTARL